MDAPREEREEDREDRGERQKANERKKSDREIMPKPRTYIHIMIKTYWEQTRK